MLSRTLGRSVNARSSLSAIQYLRGPLFSQRLAHAAGATSSSFSPRAQSLHTQRLQASSGTSLCHYAKPRLSVIPALSAQYSSSTQPAKNAEASLSSSEPAVPAVPSYGPFIDRFPKSTRPYLFLTRIDKPIGTWLLYWPCAWGIGMAAYTTGMPPTEMAYMLALFGTGAVVMRGAGCTINDMWDVKFDKMVERTRIRPIASGLISRPKAFVFLGAQLSVALGVLVQLNPYTIAFTLGSMPLVIIYPFMKRITYWPQFVLGLAFNWGALVGWTAITGGMNWAVTLPLYAAGVSWTLVYDTIYGHQDKRDDVVAGVKSTSLLFGDSTRLILTGFSATTMSLISLAGYMNGQGLPFYLTALGAGSAHLIWQLKTVDINNPAKCWKIFKSNTWFGAIIFSAIAADIAYNQLTDKEDDSQKTGETIA
ncbi:4-hydroxybenzoate polyprenyl transferase [Linderina pennispora]|uniref:4-hydroxybenzoate polyprenyltransferase, mitochondrial n=1 Tax=Linderina pennispora TaxID=61395 RepID=A0A1Y1WD41_9FUNG|nr:4-hydroxybenzoate polyprenyl transferase [Linderina pennispora]ORX71305.1 4-hydroxybenzoate polyprenyl transferase [Linderina pennispora]